MQTFCASRIRSLPCVTCPLCCKLLSEMDDNYWFDLLAEIGSECPRKPGRAEANVDLEVVDFEGMNNLFGPIIA